MFVIRYPFRPDLIEEYMNACNVGNDCYEGEHEYSSSFLCFVVLRLSGLVYKYSIEIFLSSNHGDHSIHPWQAESIQNRN